MRKRKVKKAMYDSTWNVLFIHGVVSVYTVQQGFLCNNTLISSFVLQPLTL